MPSSGLRHTSGDPASPPYSRGPYRWDQQVTFTGGISGANTPGDVWYVDGENGSDGNDGKSWDQAFETIQAAVDVSGDGTGDVIFVAPHTYTENVIVEGHDSLKIIAVGQGPWNMRVRASDATTKYVGTTSGYTTGGYCFLLLSRGVLVQGFCLDADGAYGGVYIGDGGAITATGGLPASTDNNSADCIVRDNLIRAGSVGVALHGCSDNCIVEGNVFSEQKGVDVAVLAGTNRTNQRPVIRYNTFFAGTSATYAVDENNSATNIGTLVQGNTFAERAGQWTYAVRFQAAGVHFITGNYFMCDNTLSAPSTSWIAGNYGPNGADGAEVVSEA